MATVLERIRSRPGSVVVSVCLALSGTAFSSVGLAQSTGEEIVSWVRENAVGLDYEEWHDVDIEDLSFLDEELDGKRIVYLGVPDHWVHEKYDYRLMLIHYLFARGWGYLGMEMDYSDGVRVNRYLATGDAAHLEGVALYGYTGGKRGDRDDTPDGFPGIKNRVFRSAFVSEERRFLAALRLMNETRPSDQPRLQWFGFDVGLFPSVGYEEAQAVLARHPEDPMTREILDLMKRVAGESRIQEAERLEKLAELLADKSRGVERILGEVDARELTRTVQHLADTYRFCEAAKEGTRTMKWLHGLQDRETSMAWLMDEILEGLPSDAKVILMGHNLHLSKSSDEITIGPVGSPAPTMWASIGTHLAQRYPDEVYSMWMLYDHGRHGTVLQAEGVEELHSNPAAVEHLMAKVGSTFILQLTSDDKKGPFYRQKHNFLQNGSIASCLLPAQTDAVFFVREVTEPVKQ
jgi:erythromycin esterase-like protein